MTKRVLNRIRLDKIAAVDLPCQEHAVVAIVKRAPAPGAPPAIVKKTFQEALNAQLVSDKISDTFWRAFENQWTVRDAFRIALTDEIAAGGDGTDAISGFTQAMETIATTAATLARDAASTAEPDLTSAVEEAVAKWLQEQPMKITDRAGLKKAVSDFNASTSPFAHVSIIKSAAKELGAEDELPAEGPLATEAPANPELAKALTEIAILKMAPDIRKHYDGLAAADQTAFLAKSADAQRAEVDGANATDPVVYKCLNGVEIRKSDGAALLAMAKQNDEQAAEISKLRDKSSGDTIEKRARTDYPNVALAEATDMLKSVEQLGADSAAGKSILKTLDTMNKARNTLFKSMGSTEAAPVNDTIEKARQDYNTEVAKVAREDKIGTADAMSKVRAERPDLFAAAYPDTAAIDEDA